MNQGNLAHAGLAQAARLYAAKQFEAAEACCIAIVADDPNQFHALHLLGVLCNRRDDFAAARDWLRAALHGLPGLAQLWINLGNALLGLKEHEDAAAAFRQALVLQPRDVDALNNLGNTLLHLERPRDAAAQLQAAVLIDPLHAAAHYNLGRAFAALREHAAAVAAFRAARAVAPIGTPARRIHNAMWDESLNLLLLGRYEEGWPLYESRWEVEDHERPRDGISVLDPAAVAGRRILILSEQGRGDILQCVRYAALLAERGATVSLKTYDDLVALLGGTPGLDAVISQDASDPPFDIMTSMMSLPLAFRTTVETIPAPVPYIFAPAPNVAAWARRLGSPRRMRVGLAWSGSDASHRRSAMPASAMAPLLDVAGVDFHCLQKEIRVTDRDWVISAGRVERIAGERIVRTRESALQVKELEQIAGERIVRTRESALQGRELERFRLSSHAGNALALHDDAIADFADTSALIAAMDLVITVDTAVAHLAGAMGRPVWILLAHDPEWRWMLGRDDSPWYPTARLIRQCARGDWSGAVASATRLLQGLVMREA
jgi:tetratricopeptide (TPR) repeat protein